MSGTLIESRGFNICTNTLSGTLTPNLADPLLIERKLVVWYANDVSTTGNTGDNSGSDTNTGVTSGNGADIN